MGHRFKSIVVTALIQGALAYVLVIGLSMTIERQTNERLEVVDVKDAPPPPPPPKVPKILPPLLPPRSALPPITEPAAKGKWAAATAAQREVAFVQIHKWREANRSDEERRLDRLRADLPRGTGPGRVVRLQPANLATHTLYWPANWTKGTLPIVAWANDHAGSCSNSSLPYAAFLSEIASHGYFVVAVGNDDIDYPQPEGLAVLSDGRPLRTQASALTKAVDWAVAENGRAGSAYRGKLDVAKIAYMGHGCGAGLALAAAADLRTTTAVLLNSWARLRSHPRKPPVAQFEGEADDAAVIEAGTANIVHALTAEWPVLRAALEGVGHGGAYARPDRRWSQAVVAWLDWQLKGSVKAERALRGLGGAGWSRIEGTALAAPPMP